MPRPKSRAKKIRLNLAVSLTTKVRIQDKIDADSVGETIRRALEHYERSLMKKKSCA